MLDVLIYALMAFLALMFVLNAVIFFSAFRLWVMCAASGAPVSLFQIVGMRVRRTPARLICEQRIKAKQAGIDLSSAELERSHLQGTDIEKMTNALILALRTDRKVTWEQLVDAELASG